jgi:general secretion pathway protein G
MKKGFTLVELLIVMAVIAILIGIAVPSFRGMQQEANKTKSEGDLRTLKVAIESYYKNHGMYPSATNYQLTLLSSSPKMLEAQLYDPFGPDSTSAYVYSLGSNGGDPVTPAEAKYYVLYSVGMLGAGTVQVNNTTGRITEGTGEAGGAIWISNGYK